LKFFGLSYYVKSVYFKSLGVTLKDKKMDRIQKALDKAKGRQSVKQTEAATTNIEKGSASEKIPAVSFDDITYTQTKVANISQQVLEEKRVVAGGYANPQSAVFRMLRTHVLQKMRTKNWQTLAVTSPTAGEGKSLISANLAVAMAMESNQTVLLVDMDLRNPSISEYFSLNAEIDLADVLINPSIARLVILPGKGRAENSAELLASAKMASLISDLKSQYDSRMIIFDMPPVLQTDDVLLASNHIDCALLVLEDGKNKESEIVKSKQLLASNHLLGTVLNKSEKPPMHQNY
jgi:protein-tyrosine kinase